MRNSARPRFHKLENSRIMESTRSNPNLVPLYKRGRDPFDREIAPKGMTPGKIEDMLENSEAERRRRDEIISPHTRNPQSVEP